jgi:hypothetical protein
MSSNNVMIGAGGGARGYAPAGFAAGRAAGWRDVLSLTPWFAHAR